MSKDFFTGVSIPKKSKGEIWPFSIQKHDAARAGVHYDLRLGKQGLSWAIRHWPKPGERVLAKQTVDHHPSYYSFEGPIERGYGKGYVKLIDHGETEVIKSTPDKISFIQRDRYLPKRYSLIRTAEKNWLLVNHTPSNRTRPEIPKDKVKYKFVSNINKAIDNDSYIMSPKYDGAANTIILKNNKIPEAFSHRQGKQDIIDHTYKLNLDKYLSKTRTSKPTVLWAETLAMKNGSPKPVQETSGLLNASMERTRYGKTKFKNIVYNIDLHEGKDVSQLPYEQKLPLIKTIVQKNPFLDLPELKYTTKEKKRLYNAVSGKRHTQTSEGVVVFDKQKPYPEKLKFNSEFTVYIRGVLPGKGKFTKSTGGLEFSHTPNGPIVGVIGGGFTEDQRASIYKNPSAYIGKRVLVEAQGMYPNSKALRAPIFLQFVD